MNDEPAVAFAPPLDPALRLEPEVDAPLLDPLLAVDPVLVPSPLVAEPVLVPAAGVSCGDVLEPLRSPELAPAFPEPLVELPVVPIPPEFEPAPFAEAIRASASMYDAPELVVAADPGVPAVCTQPITRISPLREARPCPDELPDCVSERGVLPCVSDPGAVAPLWAVRATEYPSAIASTADNPVLFMRFSKRNDADDTSRCKAIALFIFGTAAVITSSTARRARTHAATSSFSGGQPWHRHSKMTSSPVVRCQSRARACRVSRSTAKGVIVAKKSKDGGSSGSTQTGKTKRKGR